MASATVTVTVTVGGKGSALTPSALYYVSLALVSVQIDPAALDKLSFSAKPSPLVPSPALPRSLPDTLSRAAILVVLNKLVNSDSRGIRPDVPVLFAETLNKDFDFGIVDFGSAHALLSSFGVETATAEEVFVIDNCCAVAGGVCGVMDCIASGLAVVVDAVAALSCEAAKADVAALDLFVSGDGFSVKDETDVAGDMKALLFGSKLTGRVESGCFSEIPTVHGSLREAARLLHGRSRVELNSVMKVKKNPISGSNGKEKALAGLALHLATAVSAAGESSLGRIKLIFCSIEDGENKAKLLGVLRNGFPSFNVPVDDLGLDALLELLLNGFRLVSADDALNSAYKLLVRLREVLAWEATLALYIIETDDSISKAHPDPLSSAEPNGGNPKGEKRSEKKKKKTLGKGTGIVRQLLTERLAVNGDFNVSILAHWVEELFSYFDPQDAGLSALVDKVKEIVQSNEVRRLPKIPKGTRDFGKDQMAIRERAFSIILGIFKRHGAVGLDTPVFELRETLMGKYGEDSKLIYDLADQGGEICSLRYDLTVPFARYLAMNNITSLKRYQIGKVYRRDNPSKGRYREFYQCDFDVAGQYGVMEPDFEVIKVLTELLDELQIGDYEIKLNHRKLLDGMLEICGVPSEKFRTVCSSIDKLDKQSFEQIKKELVEEKGLTVEVADKIGSLVKKRGQAFDVLSDLMSEGSSFLQNTGSVLALKDMEILFKSLDKAKALGKIVFDLSLARGLDYYTGVIFEAVMKGSMQVGSIAAGGRYDNLVGMFSGKQVPAVGISLGIERVFTIMEGQKLTGSQEIRPTETQVLVAILGQDLTLAAELVAEMWNRKIPAEFGVHKKVMKHIERAVDGGIPWMIIIGEQEQAQGIVKLKDIKANKEEVVSRGEVVGELERRLSASQGSSQRYAIV